MFYLRILGVVMILIVSVYAFTSPSLWDASDFSDTGQIGDTIGGITAPIINLIGAILVYISFQTQITANQLQVDHLNDQTRNQKYDRNFQLINSFINSQKNDWSNFEFSKVEGIDAFNKFGKHLFQSIKNVDDLKRNSRTPTFYNFMLIITQFDILLRYLEDYELRDDEKQLLTRLTSVLFKVYLFYASNLLSEKIEELNYSSDTIGIVDNVLKKMAALENEVFNTDD